jgi:hypothetical protein
MSVQSDGEPVNFCRLCVTFVSIRYDPGWCDGAQTDRGMGTNNTGLIDPAAVMEEFKLPIRSQAFVRRRIKARYREKWHSRDHGRFLGGKKFVKKVTAPKRPTAQLDRQSWKCY